MPRQSLWGLGNILRDQVEGVGDDSDKLSWERQSVWNGVGRLPSRRAPMRLEFSERATQLRACVLQSWNRWCGSGLKRPRADLAAKPGRASRKTFTAY